MSAIVLVARIQQISLSLLYAISCANSTFCAYIRLGRQRMILMLSSLRHMLKLAKDLKPIVEVDAEGE